MRHVLKASLVAATGLLALGEAASAFTWVESGDAGALLGSSQSVSGVGSLDFITGGIGPADFEDLYEIYIPDGSLFSATLTAPGSAGFDPQLFLFDSSGMGVYANDDDVGLLSTLPAGHAESPAAPGTYYLAISPYDNDPTSAGGLIFPTFPYGAVYGPTGPGGASPLSGWTGSSFYDSGAYSIALTGAEAARTPVPEPTTLTVLAIGLCGAGLRWRRRRSV